MRDCFGSACKVCAAKLPMSSVTENNSPEVQGAIDAFLARQRKIYRINLLAAVAMRALMLIAGAILLPLANALT